MSDFIVKYTNKDIMEKLEAMHKCIDYTNGTVKLHTKLIWGTYGFTTTAILVCLSTLL